MATNNVYLFYKIRLFNTYINLDIHTWLQNIVLTINEINYEIQTKYIVMW